MERTKQSFIASLLGMVLFSGCAEQRPASHDAPVSQQKPVKPAVIHIVQTPRDIVDALTWKDYEKAGQLIASGVDVNGWVQTKTGLQTPLMMVIGMDPAPLSEQRKQMVDFLLSYGADMNMVWPMFGRSVLDRVATYGSHYDLWPVFIKHDVPLKRFFGSSDDALHWALESPFATDGQFDLAMQAIKDGANLYSGKTVYYGQDHTPAFKMAFHTIVENPRFSIYEQEKLIWAWCNQDVVTRPSKVAFIQGWIDKADRIDAHIWQSGLDFYVDELISPADAALVNKARQR